MHNYNESVVVRVWAETFSPVSGESRETVTRRQSLLLHCAVHHSGSARDKL